MSTLSSRLAGLHSCVVAATQGRGGQCMSAGADSDFGGEATWPFQRGEGPFGHGNFVVCVRVDRLLR
jgi:hypothetical protein